MFLSLTLKKLLGLSKVADIKNGTVPSDSSLTTKIFPLLRLSHVELI
jgi:hypothetical protein